VTDVSRVESDRKTSGAARYVADLDVPGALCGVTVRASCARGRIRGIHLNPGFPWQECTLVDAAAIPGENVIAHLLDDQPCLAASEVNHWGEPVLLIAHPDRYVAEAARSNVTVECDALPPELDMERSSRVFKEYRRESGDVASAFRAADAVIEGEYRTPAVDQLYIEPHGMVVTATPEEGVTVRGSLQCPFYVHHALQRVFPGARVRVIACETGGGFGGKEDYPSVLACHAALLAWKSGRPVRMIYDRAEDLAVTPKRHPSRTTIRSAFTRDGRLLGLDVDFLIDGGAYTTVSPVVLSRGLLHATGPYYCPSVRLHGRAVATNHPPRGAYRGFGVPQSCFAIETHLDIAAGKLGICPAALRRINLFRDGQETASGGKLAGGLDLVSQFDRALEESRYFARRKEFAGERGVVRRGIGLSCSFHGTGFTGSGERLLDSEAAVRAEPDGSLTVLVSSVEIGQGSATVLAQIAADAFGCPAANVTVAAPDTAVVPNSGPTVASRTTAVVGELVARCARRLRETLPGLTEARARYEPPAGISWDDATFSGEAYADYSWAFQVAEVQVDTDTGETRVDRVTAVVDAGRIVNPLLARGQVEGGIVQGVGFALSEEHVCRDGRPANANLADTVIPTSADAPRIDVLFTPAPADAAPKGLGELPLDGAAPAVVNAIAQAANASICSLPATPEKVLDVLTGGMG
jgi:CO/xanthine dehydrogenase Mo-binding subunit